MLENIQIIKIASAEENYLVNQLKNVVTNIDKNELIYNDTLNYYGNVWNS